MQSKLNLSIRQIYSGISRASAKALLFAALFLMGCGSTDSNGDPHVFLKAYAPSTTNTNRATVTLVTPPGLSIKEDNTVTTYTVTSGPAPVHSIKHGSEFELLFPYVGIYEINVLVENRRRRASDSFTIEVLPGTGFTIDGNINDNGFVQANVDVDLRWSPDGQIIASTQSDINGDFQFTNLLGTIEDYRVDVQGTP